MTTSGTHAASTPSSGPPQGRVRWRRFAAIMVPAFAALATMVVLTSQGALGVSFAISGTPFTVTASQLQGTGFEQFAGLDHDASGNLHPVVVNAIGSASLTNLCQSVSVAGLTLKITAGNNGTPATAQNLIVDATNLTGNANFSNINIGQDASTVDQVSGVTGPKGSFAQQADTVTINNLNQRALATTAGTFTLPHLNLRFAGSGC